MQKTIEMGNVRYVKSPGPKLKFEDEQSYINRSMIGNNDLYNQALDIK